MLTTTTTHASSFCLIPQEPLPSAKPQPPPERIEDLRQKKRNAEDLAASVSIALEALKNGCYNANTTPANPDVQVDTWELARLQNAEKYTKNWAPTVSIHSSDAVQSPRIPGTIYVVKYYGASDSNHVGIAHYTSKNPLRAPEHWLDAAAVLTGDVNRNADLGRDMMRHISVCKNRPAFRF